MHNVFPSSITDDSFTTLEKCVDKAFDIDMSQFMTCIVDKLSENILFYKAEQMSLTDGDGYADCKTPEEKRKLLKQAFMQHKLKATVKCIKNLLTNEFSYQQWNEYNGIHNHYRLIINLKNSEITPVKIAKIITSIENNKRLSAKQDNYYDICSANTNTFCIAPRFKTEITINCYQKGHKNDTKILFNNDK